jgi:hypothetical protein
VVCICALIPITARSFAQSERQTRRSLDWVVRALQESCSDEKREHSDAIARIQAEWDRLQKRIDAMYLDKLDGRIDEGFYRRTRMQWREEQERCERDIERHRAADDSYMDQGIQLLNLAQNARQLFMAQPAKEKRRLLNFLLSNCTWQPGTLAVEYKEPFHMLAETVAAAARVEAAEGAEMAQKQVWLWAQSATNPSLAKFPV